jgi:hypothetical protein
MASLFSPCPHCMEYPEVEITDEGKTISEAVNTVRLRNLMADIGVAPGGRSWFLPRFAKTLLSIVLRSRRA